MSKIFLISIFLYIVVEINPFSVNPHNSIALTKENHDRYIKSGGIFVIYVNDVKRYEKFVDLYHEISEVSFNEGHKNLKFGVLDCSLDKEVCDELQVVRNLEVQYYGGQNEWSNLKEFLINSVEDVLAEDILIEKFDTPGSVCALFKIITCPYCQEALKQWVRVQDHFANRTDIHVGILDCHRHKEQCKRFGIHKYPKILYIENSADGLQQFDFFSEDRKSSNIINYCERMLKNKKDASLYASLAQNTFVLLNKDNFQTQINKGNTILVFVNDTKYYEKFVNLYRELADVSSKQGNKDLFYGIVDCKVSSELCQQNDVKNNLELKTFDLRSKIDAVITFIRNLVDEFLGEDVVIEKLDQPGISCVFFKILKCKHCKEVLKYWPNILKKFEGRRDVHVGTIDCNHHREICNRFDVSRYPRFYAIINGKFKKRFYGERSQAALIKFCEDQVKASSSSSSEERH